jgi:hypothetical protein
MNPETLRAKEIMVSHYHADTESPAFVLKIQRRIQHRFCEGKQAD